MELITLWSWTIMAIVLGFSIFYIWGRHNNKYWKKRGIDGPEPQFFVGNMKGLLTMQTTMAERFEELYNMTKHMPYAGIYMILRPTWLVNDPELIKTIMIKDFAHFTDHGFDLNYDHEPMFCHLFNLRGDRWKNLRAKLTPTFTTSKMKQMFDTVESCTHTMIEYLESTKDDKCDVKELLAKFTTDVIGSVAFGLECNSFKNPDAEFRRYGRGMIELPAYKSLAQLCMFFFFPSVMRKIPMSLMGKEVNDFFNGILKKTVRYREQNNIVRNDFLQLLIQLKNKDEKEDNENNEEKFSMRLLLSHAFVFFFAGFETSSTTGSFGLYELALNPEVQKTLAKEIDTVLKKHDGKLTYDSTSEMTYLTMVIEETMRKYPPMGVLMRMCTKDYTIPGTNKVIKKDTPVIIPNFAIQRDEKYYPNPRQFDPERFTPENKEKRHHFSYLPFGEGPRICIGRRFGIMQTKLALAALISKYEFSVCDKTVIPMDFDKKTFFLGCNGGVWLSMKERIKSEIL